MKLKTAYVKVLNMVDALLIIHRQLILLLYVHCIYKIINIDHHQIVF